MTDVIGSAEIEIRATTRQLKSDMARAEKAARDELKKVEGAAKDAQRELKRAFQDTGANEFERSMRIIRNASDYTEKEVRDAAQRIARDLKGQYRDLGTSIGQTLMGVSRTAQVAFAAITAYSLKLASDAQEIESAFSVAFGTAEADARRFSDTLANDVGRDAVVLREQMTRLQLVITGAGVAADQAADLVQALTTSGVDAGSLFNTSDAEAFQKIISGLTGETEPLKAFGVVISQAAVEAELLRLGFQGNASEASEAAKSIARANLIIEGLSVAQGDAARTADSAANTTKRMTAEFNTAARDLGTQLLPVMVQVFGAATNVLRAFNDLPGGVQVAGLAFLGLIAAGGPIAGLLAGLGRVITLANQTRLALIAAGTAGTAAGAGTGAGAAAGGAAGLLSRVAPVAAGGVALGVGLGSATRAPDRDLAQVESNLAFARQNQPGRTDYIRRLERERADLIRQRDLRVGLEEIAAPPVDTSVPGGFTLPPSLQTGSDRNRTGAQRTQGPAGPTAAELATLRDTLDLQIALDLARASGDTAAIRAAEERQTLARLTADFERAGYEDAEARALSQVAALNEAVARQEELARAEEAMLFFKEEFVRAQERSAGLMDMQLSDQIELAQLSGDEGLLRDLLREEAIRRRIVDLMALTPGLTQEAARAQATVTAGSVDAAERIGNMREEFRRSFAEGIEAAINGDIGGFFDSLADRFTSRLLDALADDLFDLILNATKGAGGGGGILSSIASIFGSFGGGRATGGPMAAGSWYRTGEHGPENIFMPKAGFAVPAGAKASGSGTARGVDVRIRFDSDFNLLATIDGRAEQVATPLAVQAGAASYAAGQQQMASSQRRQRQRFV